MSNEDRPLSRALGDGRRAPPVRQVHLGLGNFFRAHQAWYSDRASDADEWGIAAFTGRSAALADALNAQDNLFTLITRSAHGDQFDVISSLSAAHAANDHDSWLRYVGDPQVRIVTLTVTEAGYHRALDGGLDVGSHDVRADVSALRADARAAASTAPGRLVAGLAARRRSDAGALTVVSCDNLPDNGAAAARVVNELAALVDPTLGAWISQTIEFATTVVDRITPGVTDTDIAAVVGSTGRPDRAPVVTEPFAEWVLAGSFAAGRPAWSDAGARFVDDVTPFEQRKLWLLNGAHSLLAYAGSARGHRTVADAISDPDCLSWVNEWWDTAAVHLSLPGGAITDYRAALVTRFENPRIEHRLAQIAADGSQKLPVRILPVLHAERSAGRLPIGAIRVLAAWINHLRGAGAPVTDPRADDLIEAADAPLIDAVPRILNMLDPSTADDHHLVDAVAATVRQLSQ